MSNPPKANPKKINRKHLLAALKHAGSNQRDLAKRLGIHETSVHRWCVGKAPISSARWLSVLVALALPLDWKPAETKAVAK